MEDGGGQRELHPTWDYGMVAASIAVSLLGTFTSTQLMCQARMSLKVASVLVWVLLASLTFGFCSIWCLHFIAMLACKFDLPIDIDVGLTFLSALLAVVFTFFALGTDLLWESYTRGSRKMKRSSRRHKKASTLVNDEANEASTGSSLPLLSPLPSAEEVRDEEENNTPSQMRDLKDEYSKATRPAMFARRRSERTLMASLQRNPSFQRARAQGAFGSPEHEDQQITAESPYYEGTSSQGTPKSMTSTTEQDLDVEQGLASDNVSTTSASWSELSSIQRRSSSTSSRGMSSLMNLAHRSSVSPKNAFIAAADALWKGLIPKNIIRGFVWSLAVTSMHYSGLLALRLPEGHITFNPWLIAVPAVISWVVCIIGSILMTQMEAHLGQQALFSFVATTGVAAMHFTGMQAAHFWSSAGPSDVAGYPPQLGVAIVFIAITTCILANALLAHAATVSRNKLAEIVWTRRRLWKTLAQKENAEQAAAARSEFIASASHEIRTPLHHLQGYSDLLSRTELTDEGKTLLWAIQRATKTLSLITNNVLDWSKLESNRDSLCRPVALDMRSVCESILVLLPNKDDEAEVEVMVVVSQNVPKQLFLDETYIHRIFLNLVSNALKFTRAGYVMLTLEMSGSNLIAKVQDTGCGVPPSFLPQLFEPFSQAQSRGSQRGTGLGLSIVKQLLHKMDGTIEVESRHPEIEIIGPNETGSTFTISIPVSVGSPPPTPSMPILEISTVAIFKTGRDISQQGLQLAWQRFGYNVVMISDFSQLSNITFKYVWVDLTILQENPECRQKLSKQDDWTVLVPYDSQVAVQHLPGFLSTSHFVPLQRPLMWHTFESRIALAQQTPNSEKSLSRIVRFASKVDILDGQNIEQPRDTSTSKNMTVLLVEDNPINQKLGTKMLSSLGYDAIIAGNGQEAIEQITKHDNTVDMILMDQSMPVKDGVTATREIRLLEGSGKLCRRHPIIAVTAVVNTESRALFKDAGADEFLAKPLSLGRLEQTLALFLRAE